VRALVYSALLLLAFQANSIAQTYSILHGFSGYPSSDGIYPLGSLLHDGAGNLYGMTYSGGNFYYGTVYKLDASGNESILYNFTGGTDGAWPSAGLVQDWQHNLYGTTSAGGQAGCGASRSGCGVVFKLSPSGKFTVLYTFTGGADGAAPKAALVREATGNLYGTTSQAGTAGCGSGGCGTVFKLATNGTLTVLHSFSGSTDGGVPLAGLLRDGAGNLYGTASVGGSLSTSHCMSLSGCGTVFEVSATGKFSVLYSFLGYPSDGDAPTAGLLRDSQGNLYGSAGDGANGAGMIFKLDSTGHETVLHNFAGYPWPEGEGASGLVRDSKGNFYGTAAAGGIGGFNSYCPGVGCGTVFKLDTLGNLTVLANLGTVEAPGSDPQSGVILDHQGNLYGTGVGTTCKTYGDCGEVFKIVP